MTDVIYAELCPMYGAALSKAVSDSNASLSVTWPAQGRHETPYTLLPDRLHAHLPKSFSLMWQFARLPVHHGCGVQTNEIKARSG